VVEVTAVMITDSVVMLFNSIVWT